MKKNEQVSAHYPNERPIPAGSSKRLFAAEVSILFILTSLSLCVIFASSAFSMTMDEAVELALKKVSQELEIGGQRNVRIGIAEKDLGRIRLEIRNRERILTAPERLR